MFALLCKYNKIADCVFLFLSPLHACLWSSCENLTNYVITYNIMYPVEKRYKVSSAIWIHLCVVLTFGECWQHPWFVVSTGTYETVHVRWAYLQVFGPQRDPLVCPLRCKKELVTVNSSFHSRDQSSSTFSLFTYLSLASLISTFFPNLLPPTQISTMFTSLLKEKSNFLWRTFKSKIGRLTSSNLSAIS